MRASSGILPADGGSCRALIAFVRYFETVKPDNAILIPRSIMVGRSKRECVRAGDRSNAFSELTSVEQFARLTSDRQFAGQVIIRETATSNDQ